MKNEYSRCPSSLHSAVALTALILCSLSAMSAARADDLLGLYIGAAYGQAHVRAQLGQVISPSTGPLGGLDTTHSAFKGMLGVRVLSFLGAEIAYMDFGKVSNVGGQPVPGIANGTVTEEQASQKGETAFALLYLPVPVVDVYVKAGLSRITTDSNVTYTGYIPGVGTCAVGHPNCNVGPFYARHDSTDTAFAYGVGLQWKLRDWAVRGEYERFDAAGANPTLLSIGMTYWLH